MDEAVEKNKECAAKKEELQQQIDKQIETIEELREMAGLVDSVARHDESNSNQGEILSMNFAMLRNENKDKKKF